ncbi:MAG: PQQ-binding-like beta-propeller repeat protein [Candidatus Marinimicrobia bacterium]|jgi:outer membrane protein assembly factor BamB|nr:PQQ-binding-like beta-propeller repeat protein [Candidatus Neomarinimicrobiota bacterium]
MAEEKSPLKWKFKTGDYVGSTPAVSDGVVYFGCSDKHLYALDTKIGKEKWKFKTKGEIYSSPTLSDGVIYFGSTDNHLYAVDRKTGKEKWKFKTGDRVNYDPAVSDGVVYFGSYDNHLYAVDIKTGEEKWKFATGDGVYSPAVSAGVVYCGSNDNHLYAVDAKTGEEKWKFKAGDNVYNPAVSDDVVYFGSADEHLYAVDSKTGKEKWKFKAGNVVSNPAVSDDVVYFAEEQVIKCHLYAVDIKTGKEKWKFETGAYYSSSPELSHGVIYFGSDDKHFYAVDTKTGEEKWSFKAGKDVKVSSLSDSVVYFGTRDGYLNALDIGLAEKAYTILKELELKRKEEEIKLKKQAEKERLKKLEELEAEKRSHWKSDTEENLKKIRELMVSSQFEAGIELALTIDDPYLLLELVDGCKIEEDGTVTLNETFDANAYGEYYDILAGALFKMILTINDIQKPESSLKLENIKVLNLCSFVKLPSNIDLFTNLKTIVITPKHSKSIPKEYSSIKDLQIKTALSAEEIVQALWDNGPADDIYNYSYETEVTHAEADYIENDGLGCERLEEVDPDADDYNPEGTEKIKIDVENYIDLNFKEDFFDKVNADTLIEESGSDMVSKEDIESTISSMLYDLCYFFNDFIVVPGSEENPWENEDTIYLGNIPTPEVSLEDINPDWTEDEYYLVD